MAASPASSPSPSNNVASFLQRGCTAVGNGIDRATRTVNQRIKPIKKHAPLIKKIILVAVCVAFALTSTLPFCIGLLLGAIYKDKVKAHLMNLEKGFKKQPACGKVVIVLATTVCALAVHPITSLAFGAYAGSKLHKLGQKPADHAIRP